MRLGEVRVYVVGYVYVGEGDVVFYVGEYSPSTSVSVGSDWYVILYFGGLVVLLQFCFLYGQDVCFVFFGRVLEFRFLVLDSVYVYLDDVEVVWVVFLLGDLGLCVGGLGVCGVGWTGPCVCVVFLFYGYTFYV